MFVGHTALALAAKRAAPRRSLGLLLACSIGLDLLWPVFLLAGLEQVRFVDGLTAFSAFDFVSYPWSHSLVMAFLWSALVAAWLARGGDRRGALVCGGLVLSHWVLDWVTHRPDLPLWPGGSPRVGLGLWYSAPATFGVEGALFLAGALLYVQATSARDAVGRVGLAALLLVQAALWLPQPWSPPPPDADAVAWVGLASAVFLVWAAWIDRHRVVRAVAA